MSKTHANPFNNSGTTFQQRSPSTASPDKQVYFGTLDSIPEQTVSNKSSLLDQVPDSLHGSLNNNKSLQPSRVDENLTRTSVHTRDSKNSAAQNMLNNMSHASQKTIQTTQLNHLILSPVMDFAKKANRPDIFKLNMTPKFHFYRDEVGEKMMPREKPHAFSFNIQKGFDLKGHPPRHRSVTRLNDRVSLLPPGSMPNSF